jgi:hypothetical protein
MIGPERWRGSIAGVHKWTPSTRQLELRAMHVAPGAVPTATAMRTAPAVRQRGSCERYTSPGAKPFPREATRRPLASPLARLNRAGHLVDGATFVRTRPKRQYPAADRIKASIASIEGIHCPDIGGANLGFALDTFSSGTISRGVAPRPFCRILGPYSPAAHFCSVHFPDLVDPKQHFCKFRLRPR